VNNRSLSLIVANLIKDYKYLPDFVERESLESINSHVMRWVEQFKPEDVNLILKHTANILKKNYVSEAKYDETLAEMVRNEDNLPVFKNYAFLNIQERGGSQSDLLVKTRKFLKKEKKLDLNVFDYGDELPIFKGKMSFVYIDDFSFSGKRIGDDIERFISEYSINNANILIVLFISHSQANFSLKKRLLEFINNKGLDIELQISERFFFDINNSIAKNYSWQSDVYFPVKDTVDGVLKAKGKDNECLYIPNFYRVSSNSSCPLGNMSDRNKIEEIFSSYGFDIISHSQEAKRSMKPLGFSTYPGFGFGGCVFSYRNTPNNDPLVFWWGSYQKTGNEAIDCWYPLIKRNGYYS